MTNTPCRLCGTSIIQFFSLGQMPLVNNFLQDRNNFVSEKTFDLSVGFCPYCYLVQLMHTVDPNDLFSHYLYFSSTSQSFLEHCKELAYSFVKRFHLGPKSLMLEIASNDGAFLQYVKELGIGILGVDPAANIAEAANQKGIPTIPDFFNLALAKKLAEEQSVQADVIYGANVLAHVPDILDFVRGVKTVLKPNGTAIFEFPYLKGLMENKFDIIYHEHVFYYSFLALLNIFRAADLEIYDVEMTPQQGGSLLIFACHRGVFPIDKHIENLLQKERTAGFHSIDTYRTMGRNVETLKVKLLSLLDQLKKQGKRIAAYSASAKGNILLNYFGVGKQYLDFIVDKSPAKQGLYTPGTHFLVCPVEKIFEERPDYLLILCWNIAEEVIQQLEEYQKAGGKFIIPVPEVVAR